MNSHPNRVRKYLLLCRVVGWVEVEFEEGSCRVSIPRMVEWRDETTRKSRVLPEQVAQSRGEETRKDKRESKDGGSLSNGFAGKDASRSPPHDFEVSLEMRQRAEDERPDIDVDRETKTFLLHTFPTLRSDWESEWMKWIINARPSDLNHQNGKAVTGRKYELISLAKMLQINRNTEESESEFLDRVEKVNQRRIRNLDA